MRLLGTARRSVGRLRKYSRPLDKGLYLWQLHRETRVGDPILIYTMAKVGSSALQATIGAETNRPVIHLHHMTKRELNSAKTFGQRFDYHGRPLASWRGDYVRWRIALSHRDAPWDVIMGVREPIGRRVSAFFQIGEELGLIDPAMSSNEMDVARLMKTFCDLYDASPQQDWFESEFRPATRLDVYKTPFPTDAGYAQYHNDRFRALLIRYEDLRAVAPQALADFLGCDRPLQLQEVNVGSQKGYAHLYERLVREVILPSSLVNSEYESRLALHFYSPSEIASFRAKWAVK